jgi:glutathione S-transferase
MLPLGLGVKIDLVILSEVTMKLIYANGACSLSVHILLEELKIPYEAIRVGLQDKKVLESYNPKSYVPALELDTGEIMTEATSLLQYLSTEHGLAFLPKEDHERAQCIEWLTYISTELHKGAAPLFHPQGLKPEFMKEIHDKLHRRLQVLEDRLKDNAFIMGHTYTVADMYALAILRILEHVKVSFKDFESIRSYKKNLEDDSVVKKVLETESKAPLETKLREFTPRMDRSSGSDERSSYA